MIFIEIIGLCMIAVFVTVIPWIIVNYNIQEDSQIKKYYTYKNEEEAIKSGLISGNIWYDISTKQYKIIR